MDSYQAGRIAVDLDQALAMTAQLSLPDRDWWVLKFAQAAVCSGARQLKLQLDEDQWLLRHDGVCAGRVGLLDCLGRDGPRRQLALCLRGAWQPPAAAVELVTHYEGVVRVLSLPRFPEWSPLERCPWGSEEATLLVVRWNQPQPLSPALIKRLRESLRLAPAAIWLNGQLINDPREGHRKMPGQVWLAPSWQPGCLAVVPNHQVLHACPSSPTFQPRTEAGPGGDFEARYLTPEISALPCWAWQSLTGEVGKHHFRVVHYGVEVQAQTRPLPAAQVGGLTTLLSTQGLKLDPSGCRLVENQAWEQRQKDLDQNFNNLYRLFTTTWPGMTIGRVLKGY